MITFSCWYKLKALILGNFLQALFPENTYGVDSGGDPNEIPKLTFEEFKV
jgi:presequence protease